MSLELSPCQNADMSRVFELVSLSFGHQHPYIEAVFPEHDTPAGRKSGAERLLSAKLNDPVASFHKVVDTATGDIIATARWNIYDNMVPEEVMTLPAAYFQDIEAKEYAEYMFTEYLKPRRNAIRQSGGHLLCAYSSAPYISLDLTSFSTRFNVCRPKTATARCRQNPRTMGSQYG